MTHSSRCTFNRANSALYFEVSSLIMASQQNGDHQHVEGEVRPRTGHEGQDGKRGIAPFFL
jgi:hypothetical protein